MNYAKAPKHKNCLSKHTAEDLQNNEIGAQSARSNVPFVNRLNNNTSTMNSIQSVYFKKYNKLIPVSSKHLSNNNPPERAENRTEQFISLASKISYKHFSSQKLILATNGESNIHKLPKRTMFIAQYAFKLPKEHQSYQKSKPSFRPMTGIDQPKLNKGDEKGETVTYPKLTQNKKHPVLPQSSKEVQAKRSMSAANTERRPDSRYNYESLFAALENGKSKSPEYKVPILKMKLMEGRHDLLPESWK